MRRPLQFEFFAVRGCAQTFVSVELFQSLTQTHVVELLHRSGRQTIATRLLTGEVFALDHRHLMTTLGEPIAHRRTCRATTDDEHLGLARRQGGNVVGRHALGGGERLVHGAFSVKTMAVSSPTQRCVR